MIILGMSANDFIFKILTDMILCLEDNKMSETVLQLLWVFINAHPYEFDKIPNKTHTIILVGMLDCIVKSIYR